MFKKLRNRIKGQSTAEYAILIALVVAAVIAMQTYAKRALQAKVRDAALYMVNQTNALGNSVQYEPYYLQSEFQTTRNSSSNTFLIGNQQIGGAGQNSSINVERASGGFQKMEYNKSSVDIIDQ